MRVAVKPVLLDQILSTGWAKVGLGWDFHVLKQMRFPFGKFPRSVAVMVFDTHGTFVTVTKYNSILPLFLDLKYDEQM